RRITEQFLHNPVKVEVSPPATTVATTTQLLVKTGREPHDKRDTLRRLIRSAEGLTNAIIFCNRKREVAALHRSLLRHRLSAITIVAPADGKSVGAIEKLIGQKIPWMGEPPQASENVETSEHRKERPGRGQRRAHQHEHSARRERTPAPVTRLDEVRPRRAVK